METSSFSTAAYIGATKLLAHYSSIDVRKTLGKVFRRGQLGYEKFNFSKLHKILILKPDDAVRQIRLLTKIELQVLLKSTDRAGRTPLCWAAHLNRGDVVEKLLQEGADIAHQDFSGNSPLHLASQATGTFALAKLLAFDHNNNERYVSMKNGGGWEPLHYAAQYQEDARFAKMLIEAGASINAKTNAGRTPMMMAARRQRPEVIRFLYDKRANTNLEDRAGWTALSLAVDNVAPSLATIDALLDAKVSLEGQGIRQESILHLVAKTPNLAVIEHLRSRAGTCANDLGYINTQARNSEGSTAKEVLSAQDHKKEIVNAFNTLKSLMNACEAASARLTV